MTETPTIFIAKESAVLRVGGDKYVIRKDRTRVEAGHPMVAQHPDLFREIGEADVHYRAPGVETARQEPVIPTPSAEQAAAEQAAAEAAAAEQAAAEQAAAEAAAAEQAAAEGAAAEGEKPKRRGGSASS